MKIRKYYNFVLNNLTNFSDHKLKTRELLFLMFISSAVSFIFVILFSLSYHPSRDQKIVHQILMYNGLINEHEVVHLLQADSVSFN